MSYARYIYLKYISNHTCGCLVKHYFFSLKISSLGILDCTKMMANKKKKRKEAKSRAKEEESRNCVMMKLLNY